MATDFLERLAEAEVPPPPNELAREVHGRLNRVLLAVHLVDLALRGTVYALAQFVRPVAHLIALTLTGRPGTPRREGEEDGGRAE